MHRERTTSKTQGQVDECPHISTCQGTAGHLDPLPSPFNIRRAGCELLPWRLRFQPLSLLSMAGASSQGVSSVEEQKKRAGC